MDTTEAMKPATKGDVREIVKAEIGEVKIELKANIEEVAAMANKQFMSLEKKMDDGFKMLVDHLENIEGQIADVKQSRVSIRDHLRLEDRVEVVEKKVGIKT